jgi:hypothetical protein
MAYEINININGEVESTETTAGVSASAKPSEQEKAMKSLGKYVASQTIQPFLQNVKTQVSQNIGLVTGNTDLQQRVNFGMEVVQYGVNAYKNAQAGAVIGSSFGKGGAVAGSIIGLALTAINTMMTIEFNKMQLRIQEQFDNYQIQQTRDRQGIAYNKSRRGA